MIYSRKNILASSYSIVQNILEFFFFNIFWQICDLHSWPPWTSYLWIFVLVIKKNSYQLWYLGLYELGILNISIWRKTSTTFGRLIKINHKSPDSPVRTHNSACSICQFLLFCPSFTTVYKESNSWRINWPP